MAYSSRANIAPLKSLSNGGSINLSIGVNGASYVKSISPKAVNILNRVYTVNSIGIKDVSFAYDVNDDVTSVTIKKYDAPRRVVTFEKDAEDNIIAVHVA